MLNECAVEERYGTAFLTLPSAVERILLQGELPHCPPVSPRSPLPEARPRSAFASQDLNRTPPSPRSTPSRC